jgi:hypothetical protein
MINSAKFTGEAQFRFTRGLMLAHALRWTPREGRKDDVPRGLALGLFRLMPYALEQRLAIGEGSENDACSMVIEEMFGGQHRVDEA